MMWNSLTAVLCALVAAALAAPVSARAQSGFDRPGGDYANAVVRSGDPAVCATRCERDARCRAWSFSYPGPGGGNAICWLKKDVPPPAANTCCVSGVRGGGAIETRRDEAVEWGIDRIGGDLRNFDVAADPNGATCKAACENEPRCRAWTYERPGYAGASPRCYLKSRLTLPRKRPCCISGVIR